jgi:hypothetical protein
MVSDTSERDTQLDRYPSHPIILPSSSAVTGRVPTLTCDRFVTMSTSMLCLTVALGSAMPTGDLPGIAESLHVSDEVSYIQITLFVLGFGIGPLAFAPRKPAVSLHLERGKVRD